MQILHSHKLQNSPRWSWSSSYNQWAGYHLWLILEGVGQLHLGKRTFPIKAGVCFILPMEEHFEAEQDAAHPLCIMGVHFDEVKPADLPPLYNEVSDFNFFSKLVERCIFAHHANDLEQARTWLLAALSDLKKHRSPTENHEACPQEIAVLAESIREDPSLRLSLDEIASALHCSRDHAIRLFKRHLSLTPGDYQLQIRMHAAENLLIFSNQSIGNIAEQLGYSDVYSFSRQFKEKHGNSPLAYRKRRKATD